MKTKWEKKLNNTSNPNNKQAIDFLVTLQEYDAVQVYDAQPKSWDEAISWTFRPLLAKQAITEQYIADVIKNTQEHGPYYIIAPWLAMPHVSSSGAQKTAFSLAIFPEALIHPQASDQPTRIWIGFCSTNGKVHMEVAIPQIMGAFEDPKTTEAILKCHDSQSVFDVLKQTNYQKYVKKEEQNNA